jgi:hypothetical protein
LLSTQYSVPSTQHSDSQDSEIDPTAADSTYGDSFFDPLADLYDEWM